MFPTAKALQDPVIRFTINALALIRGVSFGQNAKFSLTLQSKNPQLLLIRPDNHVLLQGNYVLRRFFIEIILQNTNYYSRPFLQRSLDF